MNCLLRWSSLSLVLAVSAWAAEPERTLSISGEAEIKVVPDEVTIVVGVESLDPDLAKAKRENDERLKRIIAAAKAAGIEDKRIATDSIEIEPEYTTESSDRRRVLVNYAVRRSLHVTSREVSRFDSVLSGMVAAGANLVHNVSFTSTELRKHRDHARELAMKAAHEKAAALAAAEGMKLKKPRSISEGGGGWASGYGTWNRRGSGMLQNMSQNIGGGGNAGGGEEGTNAPGQISISASVSIVYDIE